MKKIIVNVFFCILSLLFIYSCAEVTRIDKDPELSFPKLVRNSTNNKITSDDILKNVTGDKDGYTLKEIRNISETNLAKIQGKEIVLQKVGKFTATLVFEHSSFKDIIINGAKFEWNYSPSFTFNKLTKNIKTPIITTAEILGSVVGHKVGYTLKNITNISDNDLASVLGSKPNFEINLKKVGSFTVTIVLEHSKYGEATIRLAQFECVSASVTPTFFTVVSRTGRIWMDRNLGASRVAIATDDRNAYGDYYQWGRAKDGHEKSTSAVINTQSATVKPGHDKFINGAGGKWYTGTVTNLWSGSGGHTPNGGVNNPCPNGFRVPTIKEWEEEVDTWDKSITSFYERAFQSKLKLIESGYRIRNTIENNNPGRHQGFYWTNQPDTGGASFHLNLSDMAAPPNFTSSRTLGFSVRCIQDLSAITKNGYTYGTITSKTGRVWLDRNLGARRIATDPDDTEAFGDIYQFGRGTDGHEKRNSKVTTVKSSTTSPGHDRFIKSTSPLGWEHWYTGSETNLWSGSGGHTLGGGINNPCPTGFRLPTSDEWQKELATWSGITKSGDKYYPSGSKEIQDIAFDALKLTMSGLRRNYDALLMNGRGNYWSSTSSTSSVRHEATKFYLSPSQLSAQGTTKDAGAVVRCIKNK